MDLARVRDLSCLVAVVETDPDEPLKIVAKHFIPNDDIEARTRRDKVPYAIWRNEGHIVTTDGNTTDFDAIFETIMAWGEHLDIQELAYDRHFSAELVQRLDQEGVEMVPFGQGFISMNDAICGIERRLLAKSMVHNGDPVLAWCASNVILAEDPAGNRKPDKKRSKEKIDAIVALGMAVARQGEDADNDGPQIYL
jgi:phage terminase large subunit-like protein